jgi:hypothetical protein
VILKLLGGFIGTLAAKLLAFFAIERAGEEKQASRDIESTLEAVTRERDALATAKSAKEAAKHGEF